VSHRASMRGSERAFEEAERETCVSCGLQRKGIAFVCVSPLEMTCANWSQAYVSQVLVASFWQLIDVSVSLFVTAACVRE
jgi:hypothetical protein